MSEGNLSCQSPVAKPQMRLQLVYLGLNCQVDVLYLRIRRQPRLEGLLRRACLK